MKNKLESRLTAGRNINTLRYADDTILMADSKEELKSLLMKVKEKSGKAGLKLNTQKMKIMASIPIISWQIDGETMETMTDLIFLGSKITTDGDCSHEIKRHLLLGRKAMTNLDSVLKSRDITWPTKVHIMKAMAFPSSSVWIWELDDKESWAPKNWCFWTMMLEKTLKSPLDHKEIKWSQVKSLSRVWLFATPWTVPTRLLCPWDFPGKNTGVGCHCLLQEIFLTQRLNPGLPHCRQTL